MKKTTFTPGPSLINQLALLMESKEWIAPKSNDAEGLDHIVGTMSDEMKSAYTLLHQKKIRINELTQQLSEMQTGATQDEFMLGAMPFGRTGSFGIGGMFAMSFSVMELATPHDLISVDHEGQQALENEMQLVHHEAMALKAMLSAEMIRCAEPGTLIPGHLQAVTSDYSIVACHGKQHFEDAHKAEFEMMLEIVMQDSNIFILQDDDKLVEQFLNLKESLQAMNVMCNMGFIPQLSTDTTTAVFFPKDMNSKNSYRDDEFTSGGPGMDDAIERRQNAETIFKRISEGGQAYTPETAKTEQTTEA